MIKMNFDMIVFKEEEDIRCVFPGAGSFECGNSVPHAKEILGVIRLFLEEAEKMGTLNDILSEVNYTVNHDGRYVPPKIIGAEEVSLDQCQRLSRSRQSGCEKCLTARVYLPENRRRSLCFSKSGVKRPLVIPDWDDVPVFIIKNNLKSAGYPGKNIFAA